MKRKELISYESGSFYHSKPVEHRLKCPKCGKTSVHRIKSFYSRVKIDDLISAARKAGDAFQKELELRMARK